jgi:DNA-binding LytR/AlgR family response regulator
MKYKVLIVDDEFLARKLLTTYVEKRPDLELVGSCANALDALAIINAQPVDIVLLDIQMPDMTGMEFAKTCNTVPAIIFTTAYSEYALDSYEVDATDYLLKPIALPRFMQAIEKAVKRVDIMRRAVLQQAEAAPTEQEPEEEETKLPAQPLTTAADYIIIKADYKLYKINYDDLLYIEGQHEYVSFYTTGKRITGLYSLKSLEESLPADRFVRIHKSYIVSIAQIQEIEQVSVKVAGVKLPIGGSYKEALLARLKVTKV